MLNKKEFELYVLKEAMDIVSPEIKVEQKKIMKNNGPQLGIVLQKDEIGAVIYPDRMYEDYKNGSEKEKIVREAVNHAVDFMESKISNTKPDDNPLVIAEKIRDYERVKQSLQPRLINFDRNRSAMKQIPHEKYLDMAIIAVIDYEQYQIKVTQPLAKLWGKSDKEILDQAWQNYRETNPIVGMEMNALLRQMGMDVPDMDNVRMGVLSTKKGGNGAIAMADQELLQNIYQQVGSFYILPSSIHEVILVQPVETCTPKELETMVREINSAYVNPDEVLSDHVYQYTDGKVKVYENGKEITPCQTKKELKNKAPKP